MKETSVDIGKTYALRSLTGGEVQNANGDVIKTLDAGKQQHETAQESVWLVPDDCQVTKANFKRAALALGLLGGGETSGLPDGYLQAYFLEISEYAPVQVLTHIPHITLQMPTLASDDTWEVSTDHAVNFSTGSAQVEGINASGDEQSLFYGVNAAKKFYAGSANGSSTDSSLSVDGRKHTFGFGQKGKQQYALFDGAELSIAKPTTKFYSRIGVFVAFRAGSAGFDYPFNGKKYNWRFVKNKKKIYNLTPALDTRGKPCMFDTVSKKPFYNSGAGSFIVGFTRAQARKLGNLAPGSSFTVSLPVGWQEDAGVAAAKAQAEANRCVLPVQEYSEEAGAAATYALRRIWVKRTMDSLGVYVDADGQRWLVEWCVDVIGADPETLGYERYRSVEVAADYWGLTPYVEPETEPETLTAE